MSARPSLAGGSSLKEVARVFLRLGIVAFGGPAVHIAMMEDEVVRRRHWITRAEFMDLLGATNLIPGPNSTEMAIHLGRERAGWRGLVIAGLCFIVPASVITGVLAVAYVRFGARPQAEGLLYGVKPVIIAVVLQALFSLGRTAVKTSALAALGLGAIIASAAGMSEIVVLLLSGIAAIAIERTVNANAQPNASLLGLSVSVSDATIGGAAVGGIATAVTLSAVFGFFLKVGAILFGSGYVLLAFLRADLVEHRHWLTNSQLLDAVAIGQITPGPLFSTATFIGYLLGGAAGAVVATVGIFLPSFVFVALSGPLVPRLRRSPAAAAFLDGVNVGALALMAVVAVVLARAAIVDAWTALLAVASAVLLLRWRVNSAWLVAAGALVGLCVRGG
jgi:chromate transporter